MSAERVRRYLMEHGVGYETHTHPVAYTTSEVAEVGHVAGKEMAKAVMLMAGDRLVMAAIPGDRMVDLEMSRVSCPSRRVESTWDIEKRGLAAAGRPGTTRNSPESTRETMSNMHPRG